MEKSFFCVLCTLLAIFAAQTVKADVKSATVNDVTYYFTVNEGDTTCTLVNESNTTSTSAPTSYTATTISIPETLTVDDKSYTVTAIGSYCFFKCTSITSLTIPKTVKAIRSYAAGSYSSSYSCTGITSLTFADGCEPDTIANYAFGALTALTSVTLPAKVGVWGNLVFAYCTALTSVTVPATLEKLGCQMFYGDTKLSTVTFSKDDDSNCSVTAVPDGCFYNCTALTSIDFLPSTITRIGNTAFYKCTGLKTVNLPASIELIGMGAFQSCTGTSFTSLTIPATVTDLGYKAVEASSTSTYGAFQGCKYLKELTFAEGIKITYIPNNCFYQDTLISSISIPEGVTSIGEYAFAADKQNARTGVKTVTLPSTLTTIGDAAFRLCAGITGLTLPDKLTSIGQYAFHKCMALTEVNIPAAVTTIGAYAYWGCSGITSFTFAEGSQLTTIGIQALRELTSLETIELPNTITSCGQSLLWGSTKLRKANIPSSLTTVPQAMFYGCTALDTLIVPHDTPPTISQSSSNNTAWPFYNGCKPAHIFVPAYSSVLYPQATNWFTTDTIYYPYCDLTVSSLGVATLGLPFDAVLPDGVQPYVLESSANNVVTGKELQNTDYAGTTEVAWSDSTTVITANILKKNTPVYITADAGTYRFYGFDRNVEGLDTDTTSTDYGTDTSGSVETATRTAKLLTAVYNSAAYISSDDGGAAYAPKDSYVLQSHGGTAAFYRVEEDNTIKVGQYRTYLAPTSTTDGAKYLSLNLDGGSTDETTAISSVRTTATDSDAVYNLQGVRMDADNLPAGIYIKGGKKFVK